jgi:hypothetical protein
LRDDRCDALGVRQREPQANGSTVIKNIDRVAIESHRLSEAVDVFRQVLKRVAKGPAVGDIGEAEAREVRGNYMVAVGQKWNEIAEHVRGSWKAMEQQNVCGRLGTGLAIENFVPVYVYTVETGHDRFSFTLRHSGAQPAIPGSGAPLSYLVASDVLTGIKFHYRCWILPWVKYARDQSR